MKLGLLLFMLLPFAGQAYVSWRVWQLLPLATPLKVAAVVLMAVAFLSLFFTFIVPAEKVPLWLTTMFYEVGTSWIFILLYLFMIIGVMDLLRLSHVIPPAFMKNSVAGTLTVAGVIVAIFVYGNIHYHHKTRQPLVLTTEKHLDKPVRIVMMSDLHLGFHNRRSDFAKWVDLVNAERPDLVLIAGDIIDINLYPLLEENVAEEFRRINAPVYACLGNHEFYSGEPRARQFYADAGIHLLRDTVNVVGDLAIIGRDDRTNQRRKPLAEIMQNVDTTKYIIVLDHQPYNLDEAERCGVDFQLSGHTHHGQVWPISWITDAIYECSFGEYDKGGTRYYVSSGMGIWGGKFRIGTRSEYVVATITNYTRQ